MLGTVLGNADGITLGIDIEIELDSLDGYLDGSNDDLIKVFSCSHSRGLSCHRCLRYP